MMKYIAYAAAVVALLGSQFWGVPYYIRYVVSEQNKEDAKTIQTPAEVTTLIAKMESVEGAIVRVEGKVDDFSRLFTGYLERQAR